MPEAPVDEDGQPTRAEYEVGPDPPLRAIAAAAVQGDLPTPARVAFRPEHPGQGPLGRGVAASTHLRHERAAGGDGEAIGHFYL